MTRPLDTFYGPTLIVRPPVPATVNKAGANYKSEVAHTSYSPREAYDEWLAICEAILACGGDALVDFEELDEPLLDVGHLQVKADGTICPAGSGEVLAKLDDIHTGRVFTANGPWVVVEGSQLRAVMPHMLPHRQAEAPYYRQLLERIANECALSLEIIENPHRWEGMADVAVVGDKVVLTYAVPGHYDEGLEPKSRRSSREGVSFAADAAGVPENARIYAELVYPHFHGDTVHFGGRPQGRAPVLVHYPGGLWGDGSERVCAELGADHIVLVSRDDAVNNYASNSRQVRGGVLIPDLSSEAFERSMNDLGLTCHRLRLYELFGKAGGGPACATLYLPKNLELPERSSLRYSVHKDTIRARRERIPETLTVDPAFFEGKHRG
jgi:N-dimethylarginine dimethylaminohydrolase